MLNRIMIEQIETAVREIFKDANVPYPDHIKVALEQPSYAEHGDYATNIAMQLAKWLRQSPQQIALAIMHKLENTGCCNGLLARMEAAGPGFLNLFINWNVWASNSLAYSALEDHNGKKVLIEHTSINPNKSAHIGHLRNSCIGDALSRLLVRTGYAVEVHNYIDDLGNQLADTVVGLLHIPAANPSSERFGDYCWDIYSQVNRRYETNPELQKERTAVLNSLEEGGNNTAWIGMLTAERIVREHVAEMRQFGIEYDVLVWESSIVKEGLWSAAFEKLKQSSSFLLEEEGKFAGCWVLKDPMSEHSDSLEGEFNQDKVIVRSNGILTYTAKDIAYHLWKFGLLERGFKYRKFADRLWTTAHSGAVKPFGKADRVINVIDRRQEYPQAMVKMALEQLGFARQAANLQHVSYGVVSLSPETAALLGVDTSENKKSYAMSGRQGIGIKVSELLNLMEQIIERKRSRKSGLSSRTIAAASIRYYLLRYSLQTEIIYDIEQATEISGNTGVYLLYAYARTVSLLKKAEKAKIAVSEFSIHTPLLHKTELALLRMIARWPETLSVSADELAPNMICSYAHDLATMFSHFYAACPILKAEKDRQAFRVWLTLQVKLTMADALGVLGLPAPNRM